MNKEKLYEIRAETFQFLCNYATKKQIIYMTVVGFLVSFPLTKLKSPLLFYSLISLCLIFCVWVAIATKLHLNFVKDFEKGTKKLEEELNISEYGINVHQFTNYVKSMFILQGLVIVGLIILFSIGPHKLLNNDSSEKINNLPQKANIHKSNQSTQPKN